MSELADLQLDNLALQIHEKRLEIDALGMNKQACQAALETTDEWEALVSVSDLLAATASELDALETKAREGIVTVYEETHNKKPVAGFGIRVNRRVDYVTEDVIAWCREHLPNYISEKLNTKVFEKSALNNPDAVEGAPYDIVEKITATISSDLSMHEPPF